MESKAIGIAVSLAFFLFMFGAPAPSDPVQPGAAFSATETDSLAPQTDEIFNEWNRPDSPGGASAIVQDGRLVFMKDEIYQAMNPTKKRKLRSSRTIFRWSESCNKTAPTCATGPSWEPASFIEGLRKEALKTDR